MNNLGRIDLIRSSIFLEIRTRRIRMRTNAPPSIRPSVARIDRAVLYPTCISHAYFVTLPSLSLSHNSLSSARVSFTPLTSFWPFLLEILSSPCWERPAAPDSGQVSILYLRFSISKASTAVVSVSPVTSGKASSNYTRDTGIPPRSLVRSLGQLKNNRSSCGRAFGCSWPPCLSSSLSLSLSLFLAPLPAGFSHGSERDTRGEIPMGAVKGRTKERGVETRYRGRLNG